MLSELTRGPEGALGRLGESVWLGVVHSDRRCGKRARRYIALVFLCNALSGDDTSLSRMKWKATGVWLTYSRQLESRCKFRIVIIFIMETGTGK